MKLSDVLQELALGELQNTPAVEVGNFEIQPLFVPRVIHAINSALTNFYSMFLLKESQLLIQLYKGMSHYYLDYRHAKSNHSVEDGGYIKYILDTDFEPFQDDVINILEVSSLDNISIPMDDITNKFGVYIPEFNCIKIPDNFNHTHLSVTYQANHVMIPLTEPANSRFMVNIPTAMKQAFYSYVACLTLHNMGGNNIQESNAYYAKYMTLMEGLKQQGIGVKSQVGINIKPYVNNWI